MPADARLAAAILVGGRSRRMGANKALLTLVPGGPTMVELVVSAVQAVSNDIVLVGSPADRNRYPALPWLADSPAGVGPLGGIRAALAASHTDRLLVVACDMPLLNPTLLRYMVSCAFDHDALVPQVAGRLHPLHAIYHRSSLPRIEEYLSAGESRVQGWFPGARIAVIPESTVARHDPALCSCLNLNTPADLDLARQIMAAGASTVLHP